MKTPKIQNVPLVHARVLDVRFSPSYQRSTPLYLDDPQDSIRFWGHIAYSLDPQAMRKAARERAAKKRRERLTAKCPCCGLPSLPTQERDAKKRQARRERDAKRRQEKEQRAAESLLHNLFRESQCPPTEELLRSIVGDEAEVDEVAGEGEVDEVAGEGEVLRWRISDILRKANPPVAYAGCDVGRSAEHYFQERYRQHCSEEKAVSLFLDTWSITLPDVLGIDQETYRRMPYAQQCEALVAKAKELKVRRRRAPLEPKRHPALAELTGA